MDIHTHVELLPIVHEVEKITTEAATFIKNNLHVVQQNEIIEKSANSLVSYVDQNAEKILTKGLQRLIPDAGFITEEDTIPSEKKAWTWIIDPLDGTTNFLHKVPLFSVSIALMYQSDIVLGVVHEVMRNEIFSAIKHGGASLNGVKINVSDTSYFNQILVGTGFPYDPNHINDAHFLALRDVLASTRGIRRFGSAATDLCYTACGRFGAFYEKHLNPWDIAAGAIIVKEAGGAITDFEGKDFWLENGEILATAPQFQSTMLNILKFYQT